MLEKTRNFYSRLKNAKAERIRKLDLRTDPDAFRRFMLESYPDKFPPSGNPVLDGALTQLVFFARHTDDPEKLFKDFIIECLHRGVPFSPLVLLSDESEIILFFLDGNERIPEIIVNVINYFKPLGIDISASLTPYPADDFVKFVGERSEAFYSKYAPQNSAIIKTLVDRLKDDISAISLAEYLNQRYRAFIHLRADIVWPGDPPKQTKKWREERLAANIPLPEISGATPFEKDMYHRDIYRLEQYATPGCQCEEGDTVIDGGAFVGDTAVYFAKKTGAKGKVYSFEPLPENIANLKKTVAINKADGIVEVAPYALSDKKKRINFMFNSSSSRLAEDDSGDQNGVVDAIDLDSFVAEKGIEKIDYIKCDLEGSDIDFLNGARETIKKFSPKCGLVVYHKPDDILDIPRILLECQPDYKFYFRMEAEPILFATL
ncbi:MAG: FkbM family methyltransferase [Desulfovibrio sp.]|nr:FkbM family methyltransferase [Desulfovibrio sp.]